MLYEDFRFTCVFVFVFCYRILFLLEHCRYRINTCLSTVSFWLPGVYALRATLADSINHFGENEDKVSPPHQRHADLSTSLVRLLPFLLDISCFSSRTC
jgi:hypothetical protein